MSDANVTQPCAGFFGKMPSRGDFVQRNLSSGFVDAMDQWLAHAIVASRDVLGERWLGSYLQSPLWHFVLPAGAAGDVTWCGTIMPSVDRVNRYFPLIIAATVAEEVSSFALKDANAGFFADSERLLIQALEDDDLDLEAFASAVAELIPLAPVGGAAPPGSVTQHALPLQVSAPAADMNYALLEMLCRMQHDPFSIWWTNEGDGGQRMLLLDGLPQHKDYAALLAAGSEVGGGDANDAAPLDVDAIE